MKEGWEYKKLGEVCGKCSNIKWDDVSNEASYRYIDLTSVDRGDLHIHNPQNIRKDNAPSRAKQIIKAGDVIFATTRPTLRRVSIIEEQYDGDICSTGFCVLRHNEVVKSRFVFYALLYDGFYKYIEPLQTGANYPAVTDNVVKNYIIPVPPLSEQQRIVDYLDAAFAKIDVMKANAEKSLNEAKALFQASLKEMLEPKEGWEYKKLGEVCGKCSNIKWDDVSNEASYRYIDLTSVDRGDLRIHNPQNIRKDNAPSRAKQIIKAGDVIFATTRPTLRRVSIIEEQYDGDICSTGFCVLRHYEVVESRFVFYALLYDGFYKYIEPLQTGANYPAVTDNVVRNYIIPVPPLSEQQRIVATLDSLKSKVDCLQANFEKISQECDALKQAILRQVFE